MNARPQIPDARPGGQGYGVHGGASSVSLQDILDNQRRGAGARSSPVSPLQWYDEVARRDPGGDPTAAAGYDDPVQRYSYPSNPYGSFETAMSSVACNPHTASQGTVPNRSSGSELDEQLKLGLAVQLGLNGTDQVNKRALKNLVTSKQARSSLKQTVRARACVYGEVLKPSLFSRREDLGGKTRSLGDRRQARAMLAGAPLFLTQLSARELKSCLVSGDQRVLSSMNLDSVMTVREFFRAIGKAPVMDIVSLCNQTRAESVSKNLHQILSDLDYVQEVLKCSGSDVTLNPLLNAVLDGFSRRERFHHFQVGTGSVALDCLKHRLTVSDRDSDLMSDEVAKYSTPTSSKVVESGERRGGNRTRRRQLGVCYAFQRGTCGMQNCRFLHMCMSCGGAHGSHECGKHSQVQSSGKVVKTTPPHPRFRRDRAK